MTKHQQKVVNAIRDNVAMLESHTGTMVGTYQDNKPLRISRKVANDLVKSGELVVVRLTKAFGWVETQYAHYSNADVAARREVERFPMIYSGYEVA